jgi:hypothetical protein
MMTGTPWTEDELQQLRRLHENGISQSKIGAMLGRTKHSVHRQLMNLGLGGGTPPPHDPAKPRQQPRAQRAGLTTLEPLPSLQLPRV